MDSRKLVKILESEGWVCVRQAGSHMQFRHPTKAGLVTVPHPRKDLPIKTLISIEKQAGIRLR